MPYTLGLPDREHDQNQLRDHITAIEDPWDPFLIWESEWQVRHGISNLRQTPYMISGRLGRQQILPFSCVYPTEASDREQSLEQDVSFVASAIRQANEYYQAGMTVSELTRPTLMFYSALMLSQAASVAFFGSHFMATQSQHGLKTPPRGVGLDGAPTDWPTFISWQSRGDFVALYQTTRRDHYWANHKEGRPWPRFHIMECLRCVGIRNSNHLLVKPMMPLDHLLWTYQEDQQDISPASLEHVIQTPFFEVPQIVVFFMILFWLGAMSRYHPVAWRKLLVGEREEGHYIRKALAEIPSRFVRSMQLVLPPPYLIGTALNATEEFTSLAPEDQQQSYRLVVPKDHEGD